MTSGSTAAQVQVFTTLDVPADRRIELWQAHNSEALMRLRCRSLADRDFHGATVNLQLSRMGVSRVSAGTPHVIERRSDLIRRRPEDSVVLFFVLAGEAFFYHSNGVHVLRRGQLVACDCDQPFMRGFSNDFEELFLKIPRHTFEEVSGLEQVKTPMVADFGVHQNVFAASLAKLLTAATQADDPQLPDEDALLGLVAALLGGQDHTGGTTYLAAARRYIDARLSDTSLSATSIAAAVGISPRHLSRVFARVETTVPQYVLNRRLAAARALLLREESAALSIAAIARRCGFTSISHFSSSFARQFGQRASDVRRDAVLARIGLPRLAPDA